MVVREGAEGGDPRGGVGKEGVDFPTWARAGAGERGRGGRGKVGRRWRIGRCRGGSWHGAVEGHEDPIQLVGVRGEGIDLGGGGSRRLRSARSLRFLALDNTGRGRMSVGAVVETSSRGSYLRLRERRRSLVGKGAAGVEVAATAAGGAAAGRFNFSVGAGFADSTAPIEICPLLLLMTKVGGAV